MGGHCSRATESGRTREPVSSPPLPPPDSKHHPRRDGHDPLAGKPSCKSPAFASRCRLIARSRQRGPVDFGRRLGDVSDGQMARRAQGTPRCPRWNPQDKQPQQGRRQWNPQIRLFLLMRQAQPEHLRCNVPAPLCCSREHSLRPTSGPWSRPVKGDRRASNLGGVLGHRLSLSGLCSRPLLAVEACFPG